MTNLPARRSKWRLSRPAWVTLAVGTSLALLAYIAWMPNTFRSGGRYPDLCGRRFVGRWVSSSAGTPHPCHLRLASASVHDMTYSIAWGDRRLEGTFRRSWCSLYLVASERPPLADDAESPIGVAEYSLDHDEIALKLRDEDRHFLKSIRLIRAPETTR